ncbi:MAG: hypothetical protein ACRYFS_12595 [Janthinobacterium lividum]
MIQSEQSDDLRDAWVLRAGAELWKAVIAEAGSPAEDTQKALKAVRNALDCARRLRYAGEVAELEREVLAAEAVRSTQVQAMALQKWGNGRGLNWGTEWGAQWGEALAAGSSEIPDPTDTDPPVWNKPLKPFL